MRLTLRTLLAYLDDVLDPGTTREIGQKLRESPRAAALVSRIREVIRRRRLGAPDLDGAGVGIDPNIVASYLDDTLTPEQVVEVEQICLEADVQLAEVAACHQILTLVWSETRELPQSSLDRFYAVGPVPFDERLQVEGANGAAARPAVAAAAVVAPRVSRVPDYLKPAPWSQRVAPLAGIALIVLVAAVLLAMDRDLFQGLTGSRPAGEPVAANQPANVPANAPAAGKLDEAPARPPSPSREPVAAVPQPAMSAEPASAVAAIPRGIDPSPPPDAPEPGNAAATVAVTQPAAPANPPANTVAQKEPMPNANPPAQPNANTNANTPAEAAPPPTVRVPIQYTSVEGVMLRFDADDQHWYVQPRRSEVQANEIFASPDPFESQLDFDRGGFRVTLLSESAVQVLPATPDLRYALRVRRGRIVLQPGPKAGADAIDVGIDVGPQRWVLRLSGADAVAGIEVLLREPAGFEKAWGPESQHAVLYVGKGAVQINPLSDEPLNVPAGQRQVLTETPLPMAAAGEVPMLWLDPQLRSPSESLHRFAAKFEKEFDPTLTIDLSIPAVTKDPNPNIATLAARTLSLTANYAALVQAMAEAEHEEARAAAIQGLRVWLAQDKERGGLLKRELARYYTSEEAEIVYFLLWGLSPEDAKDKILSARLVEYLRSMRVEIRELAFLQLVQLTGRKYDYRPLDASSRRELAIQRWIGHLQREGGALVRAE